jgi:hypothetical protein
LFLITLSAAVTKTRDCGKFDSAGVARVRADWRSAFAGT